MPQMNSTSCILNSVLEGVRILCTYRELTERMHDIQPEDERPSLKSPTVNWLGSSRCPTLSHTVLPYSIPFCLLHKFSLSLQKCPDSPPRLRTVAEKLSSETFSHLSLLEVYFGAVGAAMESCLLMSAVVSIHYH